jgi:hypothetical protein
LALNVFQEFDLDAEDFSDMDKWFHKIKVPFKKVVHNNYIQKTKDKLSKLTDNVNFLVAGLNDNLKRSDIHLLRYYK